MTLFPLSDALAEEECIRSVTGLMNFELKVGLVCLVYLVDCCRIRWERGLGLL